MYKCIMREVYEEKSFISTQTKNRCFGSWNGLNGCIVVKLITDFVSEPHQTRSFTVFFSTANGKKCKEKWTCHSDIVEKIKRKSQNNSLLQFLYRILNIEIIIPQINFFLKMRFFSNKTIKNKIYLLFSPTSKTRNFTNINLLLFICLSIKSGKYYL